MIYAWLVENFTPEGQSTGLYMACQVNMTLTADVNAARKFRRQRTAEFRAADMREARRGDWRAVEHGFDDSKTPNVYVCKVCGVTDYGIGADSPGETDCKAVCGDSMMGWRGGHLDPDHERIL